MRLEGAEARAADDRGAAKVLFARVGALESKQQAARKPAEVKAAVVQRKRAGMKAMQALDPVAAVALFRGAITIAMEVPAQQRQCH